MRPKHAEGNAFYNPNNIPIDDLPIIFGFNNGGYRGWYVAQLIAEDGTALGGHICSNEKYMYEDLGIWEGTREDRHLWFKQHYPDGYRMLFVSYSHVYETPLLLQAFDKNALAAIQPEGNA